MRHRFGPVTIQHSYWYYLNKIVNWFRFFRFNRHWFRYFTHTYNTTWKNERAVEVPIIWSIVKQCYRCQARVLEVGNVLSHYFPIAHQVVDKYEVAPGVINADVVSFAPQQKFELIVSISTLEHVGWDEQPKQPKKLLKAFAHLITLLAPGGELWFSAPIGYNDFLDKIVSNQQLSLTQLFFLRRVSANNRWQVVPYSQVQGSRYGTPYQNANALVIGYFRK